MPMTNEFFDRAVKTYLRFVLDELKLSPSGLAKQAGISSTTITRVLNDPTHKYSMSMTTLGKIVAASGISPQPFFEATDFVGMSMVPYESPDLYDENWGEEANGSPDSQPNSSIVIGEAAAGVWKSPTLVRIEDYAPIGLTVPFYPSHDVFALIAADDSSIPFVRRDELALCVRRRRVGKLNHGSLVVCERWRDSGSLMELSLRRLVIPEASAPYLRCDNPDHAETIPLPADLSDTPDTKIVGLVQYAVRTVADWKMIEEANDRIRRKRRSE